MADMKLKAVVKGLDNVSDDHDTDQSCLRVANNIDITNKGQVSSMPAVKLVSSGNYHSLYSDDEIMSVSYTHLTLPTM
jgi:hypothetical protein